MPAMKHLHTYERSPKSKLVYRCVHPECSHYTHRDNLRGKKAMCKCGREIIITSTVTDKHLRRKEIKCDVCLGKNRTYQIAESLAAEALATRDIEVILNQPASQPIQLELEDEKETSLFDEMEIEGEEEYVAEEDD